MTRSLSSIALCCLMCTSAAAQVRDAAWARSMLKQATLEYDAFQVERALVSLDSVMLRKDLLAASEVASAHKLMGAGNAVMGRSEAATDHFVEALKLDFTTMLDPRKFSQTELSSFNEARKRWLAGMSPDARRATVQRLQIAEVRIASAAPNATFSVDGVEQGPMTSLAFWTVPGGKPVRIAISSKKCTTPWDTTLTVPVGAQLTIGRRSPTGCM